MLSKPTVTKKTKKDSYMNKIVEQIINAVESQESPECRGYDAEIAKDFQSRLLKVMMMLEKSKGYADIGENIAKEIADFL